jgi:pimeloyl-ACP methyl ester carboxylesterase
MESVLNDLPGPIDMLIDPVLAIIFGIYGILMIREALFPTRLPGYIIQRSEAYPLHHARGIHTHNYSGISIFDILFGTFKNPKVYTDERAVYKGASNKLKELFLSKDISEERRKEKTMMKFRTAMMVFLMLCANWITAQSIENKDRFTAAKKSVQLSTGIEMKYFETGTTNGIPLVLLHGYTDTSRSFQNIIRELLALDKDLWIIAPDLRGHGETSLPELNGMQNVSDYFEMSDYADDILDLIKQKNIARIHLAGHSMGSIIAQEIALKNPEKISTLILLGTTADPKNNVFVNEFLVNELVFGTWKKQLEKQFGSAWREKLYRLTPMDMGSNIMDFLKENWVTETYAPAALLDSIYNETIKVPLGTWFGALEGMCAVNNTGRLENLKTRTMILWATGDVIFTDDPDQKTLKMILEKASRKNSTVSYFKTYGTFTKANNEIGHNFHWGIPKHVANDIFLFITNGNPNMDTKGKSGLNNNELLLRVNPKIQFFGSHK